MYIKDKSIDKKCDFISSPYSYLWQVTRYRNTQELLMSLLDGKHLGKYHIGMWKLMKNWCSDECCETSRTVFIEMDYIVIKFLWTLVNSHKTRHHPITWFFKQLITCHWNVSIRFLSGINCTSDAWKYDRIAFLCLMYVLSKVDEEKSKKWTVCTASE